MKPIFKRIKNWRTSIIGLIILVFLLIAIWFEKISVTEPFTLTMTLVSVLLFASNDALFIKNFFPNKKETE